MNNKKDQEYQIISVVREFSIISLDRKQLTFGLEVLCKIKLVRIKFILLVQNRGTKNWVMSDYRNRTLKYESGIEF